MSEPAAESREARAERLEREKAEKRAARIAKRKADPGRARLGQILASVGLLGLILLLVAWFALISPPERVPRAIVILLVAGPLLLPLRGVLHARRYTHQWVGFLAMPYFAFGIDAWANHGERGPLFGIALTLLAAALFVGSVLVARYTASEPTT